MQSITARKQVSSRKLAAELLELWHHLMRGSSEQMYALIAELDISITQMKTLHVLADGGSEVSVKELSDRLGLSLPGASRIVTLAERAAGGAPGHHQRENDSDNQPVLQHRHSI